MLRKVYSISLSLVLLIALGGVVVTKHYCMGHLRSIVIVDHHEDACGDCGMAMDDDCCDNDSKYYSFDEDFSYTVQIADLSNSSDHVTVEFVLLDLDVQERKVSKFRLIQPPPDYQRTPIFKKVSSYLI